MKSETKLSSASVPTKRRSDDEHAERDDRRVDQRDERDAADVAARGAPRGGAGDRDLLAARRAEARWIQPQTASPPVSM